MGEIALRNKASHGNEPFDGTIVEEADHGPERLEAEPALRLAVLESRQRWRQFAAIAADIMFETDIQGRLTFTAPDVVLGWTAAALLGRPGQVLLHDPVGPDPFCFTTQVQRRHTWFRTAQGAPVCMALTTTPMLDEAGRHRGVRGIAVNVTGQERADTEAAYALRRGEALDRILNQMRQEVLAPRMMQALLDGVTRAMGAQGAAVLDLVPGALTPVLHQVGGDPAPLLPEILNRTPDESDSTRLLVTTAGVHILLCPACTRFGEVAALLAWRAPGSRDWDADDLILAASITGVIRIVLEHEAIQRELARQARTDPLTGLMNRRAFIEEAGRRLDRLVSENLPAALMFIDLDGLKQLNDQSGHDTGDAALLATSALLRRTFRPTDLVARLGGDEFAVWLDAADSLTAAERAEALRLTVPKEFEHLTTERGDCIGMSIGIAMRQPNSDETLDALIQRADQAMYDVKRNGRGHWRVSKIPRTIEGSPRGFP